MLGLSHREDAGASVEEIDDVLMSLVDSLDRSADPFDRLRIRESIDVYLDQRIVAMARQGGQAD